MHEIFVNRDTWISFAESHNASVPPNAIPLNGSQSYTLVAIHVAGDLPIPKSVLLDTKRARGKFIADHFVGLRALYESGVEAGPWLHSILKQCRELAAYHRLDVNKLIEKVIELTESRLVKGRCRRMQKPKATNVTTEDLGQYEPYDIKI